MWLFLSPLFVFQQILWQLFLTSHLGLSRCQWMGICGMNWTYHPEVHVKVSPTICGSLLGPHSICRNFLQQGSVIDVIRWFCCGACGCVGSRTSDIIVGRIASLSCNQLTEILALERDSPLRHLRSIAHFSIRKGSYFVIRFWLFIRFGFWVSL